MSTPTPPDHWLADWLASSPLYQRIVDPRRAAAANPPRQPENPAERALAQAIADDTAARALAHATPTQAEAIRTALAAATNLGFLIGRRVNRPTSPTSNPTEGE